MGGCVKLRDYQEQAADFLYEHDRAMILAPVGAGKTAITLAAMQDVLIDGYAIRFLVLAPKRVCTDVWPVEQPKWAPGCTLAVAVGTPAQRKAALYSGAQIIVSNYDNIQWLAEQNLAHIDAIVFDELTKLKNPSGTRFKALFKVMDPITVRWGLTGSFTSNGLEDVFGQCKIVDQSLLGRAKGAFMQQYFVLINKDFGEWEPRKGSLELVMQRIKPATFVLEPGEYKDKLPPLHTVEVACKMDMTGYKMRTNMPIPYLFTSTKKSLPNSSDGLSTSQRSTTKAPSNAGTEARSGCLPCTRNQPGMGLTSSTAATTSSSCPCPGRSNCTSRLSGACIVAASGMTYGATYF
jgi:hypothetical protein